MTYKKMPVKKEKIDLLDTITHGIVNEKRMNNPDDYSYLYNLYKLRTMKPKMVPNPWASMEVLEKIHIEKLRARIKKRLIIVNPHG